MRLLVPFGTRPEIVKLAPVVHALRRAGHTAHTVATGQHWDRTMAGSFLADLDLAPDTSWAHAPNATEAERVGGLLTRAFEVVAEQAPDAVVLLGDTYTVPIFCLAARRHGVPVVHLEAGLRSFNQRSMEEVNRRVAAAAASLHLAPTTLAAQLLAAEGVDPARVVVVGNPVIDAVRHLGVPRLPVEARRGVVVTAHRATNVDDPVRLATLVEVVSRLAAEVGPVRFPLHPRTAARLDEAGLRPRLDASGAAIGPPLAYEEMLHAIASAALLVTDSGGVQEEAAWFGVPTVVLRRSTPRWESVLAGTSTLIGLDDGAGPVLDAARAFTSPEEQRWVAAQACPYGEGDTGERVVAALQDAAAAGLLTIAEPAGDGLPPAVAALLTGCAP